MSIRPPKALAPRNNLPKDPLSAALEHEVLAEKAATYSRLVMKLEKALAQLREFDSARDGSSLTASPGPANPSLRGGGMSGRRAFALASLRSENKQSGTDESTEHEALLNAAGQALWYVMVQRELCGFRRHDLFYKELNVPHSVRLRMGMVRSR